MKKNSGPSLWLGAAIIFLVILVVLAAALALRNKPASNTSSEKATSSALPLEVSVTDAAQMRADGAYMLDVREQSEWDQFHMPDAQLIPLATLESRISDLPKDRDIVVVCRSGNRSAQGRDILLRAGFSRVTSMAGGMNEWQSKGLPTVTGP